MKLTLYTLLAICFSLKSYGAASNSLKINSNDSYMSIDVASKELKMNTSECLIAEEKSRVNKEEKIFADPRLKIRLGFYATSNFKRQILITIDERATDGVDYGFDAVVKDIFPNDLYWVLENKKFNIQGVKDWTNKRVVPIGINSKGDGPVKIKVDALENPIPKMEVYLRDNDTMETYDIVNGEFEINLAEGEFNDKYAIVFEPKVEISDKLEEVIAEVIVVEVEEEVIAEIENKIEVMEVYVSGYNNDQLKIKKPQDIELTHISMFNLLGQQISVWNSNLDQNEMDLTFRAKKGVHLVVMNTNLGRISKKVIVN